MKKSFCIFLIVTAVFAVAVSSQHALAATAPPQCLMSNASGAGSPSYTVNVPAPVSGGGDSSAEINSAISTASAAGGGNVVLQAGTYYISNTITVQTGVNLIGASEATTIIQATTSLGSGSLIQTSANNNLTIQNMTLNQNGSNQTTRSLSNYLLDLSGGTNYLVQNVATRNPSTYAIGIHNGASGFCILNNDVEDTNMSNNFANLDGIHVTHASWGDIVNNFVDNMAGGSTGGDDGIAIQVEDCDGPGFQCWDTGSLMQINIKGNIVRGGATAGDLDFAFSQGLSMDTINVEDNEFWGGPDGIRDADYGGGGSLSNVTITNNISHNNAATPQQQGLPQRGYTLPYNAGVTQSNIVVDGWYWCADAGGAPVPSSGTSNGVTASNVVQYTNCGDSPSTITGPPVYPPSAGSAPAAPTNLAASAASSSQINLSWTGSTNTTGYNVYRSTNGGFTPGTGNQIASGLAGTTYNNTGLAGGTTYYYVVEAANGFGASGPSNQASAETSAALGTTPDPTFAPPAGTYTSVQQIALADSNSTASIYYTTDGSTPVPGASPMFVPGSTVWVNSTETINAVAVAPGYSPSNMVSATYTINIVPDFTLTLGSSSMAVLPGGSSYTTVTINGINAFNGVVSFSCSGLPAGSTCTFAPAKVTGPGSSTLTIGTSSSAARMNAQPAGSPLVPLLAMAAIVGIRIRRRGIGLPILLACTLSLVALTGCGKGASTPVSSSGPTVATVSVIGTSGNLSHSVSLTVTLAE